MRLSRQGLKYLLLTHLVELRFTRRTQPKMGGRPTRRMLCTLDPLLLNSALGKKILGFNKPMSAPAYNAASKNLLVVWDLFRQDWRAISMESCDIVTAVTTRPQTKFWDYFNSVIAKMSKQSRAEFFDK